MKHFFFLPLIVLSFPALAQNTCKCQELKETIQSTYSLFDLNGQPYTGTCIYYGTKLKVQRTLVNGRYEGETNAWDEEGKLVETSHYKAGELHGSMKMYYPSGKLQLSGSWNRGLHDGKWISYYENGQVKSIATSKVSMAGGYPEGWKEGPYLRYYENGKLKEQGAYTSDEETGTWTEWYENGKKKSEKFYKTGPDAQKMLRKTKVGTWSEWDESGKLVKTEKWVDGKLAETKTY